MGVCGDLHPAGGEEAVYGDPHPVGGEEAVYGDPHPVGGEEAVYGDLLLKTNVQDVNGSIFITLHYS